MKDDFDNLRGGSAMSARGAQSEREIDRKGPVRAICPDIGCRNESVASAPLSFDEYFSFDAILNSLAKWRVRVMARRSRCRGRAVVRSCNDRS